MKIETILKNILKESDYKGSHKAPSNIDSPLYDLEEYFPNIYSSKGLMLYGDRSGEWGNSSQETYRIILATKGKPNKLVKVYRAIPKDLPIEQQTINYGDWVALSKTYSTLHGKQWLKGDYKIITKNVPAKDLFNDGNSMVEFGYNPS